MCGTGAACARVGWITRVGWSGEQHQRHALLPVACYQRRGAGWMAARPQTALCALDLPSSCLVSSDLVVPGPLSAGHEQVVSRLFCPGMACDGRPPLVAELDVHKHQARCRASTSTRSLWTAKTLRGLQHFVAYTSTDAQ
eukprot:260352-Chlamydomonas_euryale.AAC.4